MKKIERKQSKPNPKNIVAVKVMAFMSWIIYLGIAFANNMMIEAFIFSIGLVIVSYLVFGRNMQRKQELSSANDDSQASMEDSPSQNYLSVFFHCSNS